MNAITAIETVIIMILLIWKLKDSKNKKTWIRNLPEPVVEYVIKEAIEPTKDLTPENIYDYVDKNEWDVCALSNFGGRSIMAYNANDKHTYIIDIDYDMKFSMESWARAFDKFARTVNDNFVEVLW